MLSSLTKIMKAAWTIARKAARQFGGKPRPYFAEALRQAWAWSRAPQRAEPTTAITVVAIERETPKAVQIRVEIENGAQVLRRAIWFPASQIHFDGAQVVVPAWLARAKLAEIPNAHGAWFN